MAGGRPTIYSSELANKICEIIATHPFGIRKLCSMFSEFPEYTTIFAWKHKFDEFSNLYTKAKQSQVELLVDETLDIADETSNDTIINASGNEVCNSEYVNRSRLRIETRKWIACKLAPKIYGDRVINEVIDNTISEQAKAQKSALDEANKKDF